MDGKTIIAVIVAIGVSLGILYLLDTTVFGGKSDLVQNLIKIITVLVVVGIAGFVTKKIVHKEGINVKVDGLHT